MRTRLAVAAVVIALATTSCSTSRVAKSSTVATTAVTTSGGPPVTEPATTTSTFGPPLIVTALPTTTTPKQALEAEIRAEAMRLEELAWACTRMPAECDPSVFADEPFLSFYRTYLTDKFIDRGRRREADAVDPTYSVIGPIVVTDDAAGAEYDVCYWNTEKLVQALAGIEPTVIDELKSTSRLRKSLRRVDGVWRTTDVADIGQIVVGRNDCGPRP
jgi:hypothetical protein